MGFGAEVRGKRKMGYYELIASVEPEDLLRYGLIPELIGRLPVTAPLDRLTRVAMKSILLKPKNALIKQYKKLFEMEGVDLSFDNKALEKVVDGAMEKDTGARALRSIMENVMSDLMFDLPDMKDVDEIIITEKAVSGEGDPKFVKRSEVRRKRA